MPKKLLQQILIKESNLHTVNYIFRFKQVKQQQNNLALTKNKPENFCNNTRYAEEQVLIFLYT